jgi:hypothetical protein
VVWVNVGNREKRLMLLMRERDEPAGKPIAIWGAVYEEFGLKYEPYKAKCSQKAFLEERYIRRAFERIFKRKYAKPAWAIPEGYSLTDPFGGTDFDCCILTPEGRLIADHLKHQEQLFEVEVKAVKQVLNDLFAWGWVDVTCEQIRKGLWETPSQKFEDRMECDRYWNDTKLGLILKECPVRCVRPGTTVRPRRYRRLRP